MSRIKNTSGEDRLVPGLAGRLVMAGQVVDVDLDQVTAYTQQEATWAPADDEAQELHDEMLEAIAYLRALDEVPEPSEADVAALLTIALSELGARDVIDDLVPAATAEGLTVLIDIEQAGKGRTTILSAARKRLEELTGQPAEPVVEPVEPVVADEGQDDDSGSGDQPAADTSSTDGREG